jgi:hypothetical protein
MGFSQIVKHIPGLNLAKIGDHKIVQNLQENGGEERRNEIETTNRTWIGRKADVAKKTVS